jgi:2,3-bisphosphoglycerate-independent phosphoglycerate mutase
MTKKFGLIILDGWGIGNKDHSDAVFSANTPNMDAYLSTYPTTTLTTFGEAVGLPAGQMGNSEVGHLNIGAGRVVYQELTRINKSIKEGDFFKNPQIKKAAELAKKDGRKVHLLGLVSKGGVHSSQNHLNALVQYFEAEGVDNIYIHAITDGRDCDPRSGKTFIAELESFLEGRKAKIASVIGRYFAMDRDKRWERVSTAYQTLVHRAGQVFKSGSEALKHFYEEAITDEFIPASVIDLGEENAKIEKDDIVICFNFRTDRLRELTVALTQTDLPEFDMKTIPLHYFTMTTYDETFKGIEVIFTKSNLENTLGEVLSKVDKTQVRIAETEKYPHVTFFFSGGRESEFPGESRLMAASPKVATYDLQPEMSAPEVRDKMVKSIKEDQPDFFCLNFANADMVGHTGVFDAIVKSVETVDSCLGDIVKAGQENAYEFLIIADHGNADFCVNEDGSPNTAHSLNPVPAVLVTSDLNVHLKKGILADVAPTVLKRMGIAAPMEMDGESLVVIQ